MEIKTTYIGTLNGVHRVWCGVKPSGAIITKEIEILYPDEGKKLRKKGEEELLDFVILKEDNIEDYEEIDDAK